MTRSEKAANQTLEQFVHRLVYLGVADYDTLFAAMGPDQCLELREAKLPLKK